MKNKYDTSVVCLYASGKEHLLPEGFRKQIPYSTISAWRRTDSSDYLGHEFRRFFEEASMTALVKSENEKLKRMLRSITKSWITLRPEADSIVKKAKKDKELQKKILDCILLLKEDMGIHRALKLFCISKSGYNLWVLEHKVKCKDSFISLCARRHPHQLRFNEIRKMKRMLTDPELSHWPIVSIANLGLRKGNVIANIDSWYKYARLLDIKRKAPVRKTMKTEGLKACYPNEYLHVDTTYYPINSARTVVITFVMDNYSKMILGYHVGDRISFEVVKEALARAVETIRRHPTQRDSYLVADGGRENHNRHIDEFISELSGKKITKITALKDICFSNSPVEAIHRIMKGRYMRNREFNTVKAFLEYLEWAVRDYNSIRPHYRHKPLTPEEAYFGRNLGFNEEKRIRRAIKGRMCQNKCSSCTACCNEPTKLNTIDSFRAEEMACIPTA